MYILQYICIYVGRYNLSGWSVWVYGLFPTRTERMMMKIRIGWLGRDVRANGYGIVCLYIIYIYMLYTCIYIYIHVYMYIEMFEK